MMKDLPLTEKAKKLSKWIDPALELIAAIQILDDDLFQSQNKSDEYDGEWLKTMAEDYKARRRDAQMRLVHYRLTITEMIKNMDVSSYKVKSQEMIRKFARLRYYRGLPITKKTSRVTVENEMDLSKSMLAILNRISLNAMAEVWDENEPPI